MKKHTELQRNYFNYHSAASYNSEYNEKVRSLLDDFFSPDELKDFENYVFVGEYRYDLAEVFSLPGENETNIIEPIRDVNLDDLTLFSAYEKMLFSHFFYGKLNTYIISGAMGSGKTTTINYILKILVNHPKYKQSFLVKLDFAKGYGHAGSTIDEILHQFHDDFYKKIKAELIERIHIHSLTNDFIFEIKQHHQYFSDFYDLSFNFLEKNNKDWTIFSEKERVYEIFKYIENETDKGSVERLNLVMYFVSFISGFLSKKGMPSVFICDNIDKLPPAAQRAIFINVLALNAIAKVKMVFTMRRSTKAKINKVLSREETPLFENRAQYPYAHIYHHGPSVSKIYIKKLEELILNIENIELFKHLDKPIKDNIKLRAKEVLEKLKTGGPFKHAFNGISGQSKRLALTLANRPFCNNVIKYDSESNNLQSLIRTLYVGNGEEMRINLGEKYVCNIYSDSNNQFTLLNYFILHILEEYHAHPKLNYLKNVKNLYDFLYNYLEYSCEQIISAFNFLLSDKRALIGCEYFPKYETLDDILRLKDNLRITELGDRYFNNLILNGSIYNQVCLLSLKWLNLNADTYKNDSIAERFADLRFCISYIREEEEERFKIKKRNTKLYKKEILLEEVSYNLVKLFANSLINILPSLELRDTLKTELLMWRDLVFNMNYIKKNMFKEESEIEKICKKNGIV